MNKYLHMYIKYFFVAFSFLILINECCSKGFRNTKDSRRRSMVFNFEFSKPNIQDTSKIKAHFTKRYHLRMYPLDQKKYLVFIKGSYITCIINKYRLRITDLFNGKIRISEIRIKRRKMKNKHKHIRDNSGIINH